MTISAPDYRYNPFDQTFSSFGHGYLGNPKEVHVIPSSAPYYVYLNEIPRDDSPSTLLVNEQGGSSWTEVSFSTSPAAGQFRAVYGGDETKPISIVGQGTIEFNSADAGKTMEFAYYGMGAIVQNQIFNKILEGFYGAADSFLASLISTDTINEKTANAGVTIDGVILKDEVVEAKEIYTIQQTYDFSGTTNVSHDFSLPNLGGTASENYFVQVKIYGGDTSKTALHSGLFKGFNLSAFATYDQLGTDKKGGAITAFSVGASPVTDIRVTATLISAFSGTIYLRVLTLGPV